MSINQEVIPNHVGFILDGNRRWAKEHGKTSLEGHRAGYKALRRVTEAAFKRGIKFVSVYVFSTENWSRKAEEVDYLMDMALKVFEKDISRLNKQGVRVLWLGTKERLSDKHQEAIKKAVELTRNNVKGTLCFCFNYGGTQEIVDGIKKLFNSNEKIEELTPDKFRKYLYEPIVPDIDIVVRSSGEERISNFMLWRSAYSEMFFMNKNWPDFGSLEVGEVITEYQKRQRRFGA